MVDQQLRTSAADGAAADLETAWYAIHNGTTSGDQVSNERLQPSYDPASGGEASLSSELLFTGPPGQAVSHLGVWDAQSGGTLRFVTPLSGDLAFNTSGELRLDAASITVT